MLSSNALFVLTIMFSRKWVIFQKVFSIKLSHFPMFGSDFKWVKKQSPNFPFLPYCEKVVFQKKLVENESLKISHTFYVDQR